FVGLGVLRAAKTVQVRHLLRRPALPVAIGFVGVMVAQFDMLEAVVRQRQSMFGVFPPGTAFLLILGAAYAAVRGLFKALGGRQAAIVRLLHQRRLVLHVLQMDFAYQPGAISVGAQHVGERHRFQRQ